MVTIVKEYFLVVCVVVTTNKQTDKLTGNPVRAHYSIAPARESEAHGAHSKIHSYTSCNTSERFVLFFLFLFCFIGN